MTHIGTASGLSVPTPGHVDKPVTRLLFARLVRADMRKHAVTIRQLAASMQITMKRVREVRDAGAVLPGCTVEFQIAEWTRAIRDCAATRY